MSKLLVSLAMFLSLLFLGQNCTPSHGEDTHHHGLMDEIRAAQTPVHYDSERLASLDTNLLIKVHASIPDVGDFFTNKRVEEISSFPCANCHNKPLAQMKANQGTNIQKAHWNIQMVHANSEIMNCTTCHSESNMNQLTSLTQTPIAIDESFKLCGQCHATQIKDWQGGAHGVQLNGWKPPRVAKTCVSCHNPHQPGFPSRFPARLNTYELNKK